MTDCITFAKLSGSGNDFVCIDNRDGRFDPLLAEPDRVGQLARRLCRRGISVGADGVIFAVEPEIDGVSDIGARFFEADGSEAELCGNGTGCFVRWVCEKDWAHPCKPDLRVLTPAGVVRGRIVDNGFVRVCIPLPEQVTPDQLLTTGGCTIEYDFAITGVPHVVTYVDNIDEADVHRLGKAIRHHEQFQPRGANANFVQVLGEGKIAIRTWEFGVEGETMACGTGTSAAAILAARRFGWPREYTDGTKPIEALARSGDSLRVWVSIDDAGQVVDLCLETFVRYVMEGQLHPELALAAVEPDAAEAVSPPRSTAAPLPRQIQPTE
jgi:diaminopimelate epimerase